MWVKCIFSTPLTSSTVELYQVGYHKQSNIRIMKPRWPSYLFFYYMKLLVPTKNGKFQCSFSGEISDYIP